MSDAFRIFRIAKANLVRLEDCEKVRLAKTVKSSIPFWDSRDERLKVRGGARTRAGSRGGAESRGQASPALDV